MARVPEGFLRHDQMCQWFLISRSDISALITKGVGFDGEWWYDTDRVAAQHVKAWCHRVRPAFPALATDGTFAEATIQERAAQRAESIHALPEARTIEHLLARIGESGGFRLRDSLDQAEVDTLQDLSHRHVIVSQDGLFADPLRFGPRSIHLLAQELRLEPLRDRVRALLEARPSAAAPYSLIEAEFGLTVLNHMLSQGDLCLTHLEDSTGEDKRWLHLPGISSETVRDTAREAAIDAWESALRDCGSTLRPGARDGRTARAQVLARTYTLNSAAQRLSIRQQTLERAIREDRLSGIADPEGKLRIPARDIEAILANPEYAEHVVAYEPVHLHDIALVCEASYSTARRWLQRAGLPLDNLRWGQVRGRWHLPEQFIEYRELVRGKSQMLQAQREAEFLEHQHALNEERMRDQKQREALRARLVAAFPTWRHQGRVDQRVVLHVGPPNSGKTHVALESLAAAGSGWYLAPLRLLAFEVFDRLNRQGVLCNLLTGEEHVPVPGAAITAATVEMFSPSQSGQCVVIDESQMLADADRGWAWTRALMEAEPPEIHVIGPPSVAGLVEQLARAAAIPFEIIEHERLAPIQVANDPWPLSELMPRTILVAFSRQTVLKLKTELERMKRTVSVIYGSLPPEVRRRQSDRFASLETEICVATDAVGMGLNLPADYVCFYEVEKFDGRDTRLLTPAEVQQIGGRAGRYGISTIGEVGATTRHDLRLVRQLFAEPMSELTHAHVAPTVEDLDLIPGNLATRLRQWASLQSIPESLHGTIETADMTERIELASMLTDREVRLMGLEAALKLVNAPTRQNTRTYWYQCARAMLTDRHMPLPPVAPREITNTVELDSIEYAIACSDIYLWLSQRQEFAAFAPEEPHVRQQRLDWSMRIDEALLKRIKAVRRCSRCGAALSPGSRFSICNNCFRGRAHV